MARMGRLAALAVFTLMASPQFGFAKDIGAPVAVGVRLSQDESAAKLVFDLSRPVDAQRLRLGVARSHRCRHAGGEFSTRSAVGRVGALSDVALVKGFRFGLLAPGRSRIVIDLARAACPAQISARPIVEGEPAARLIIELKPCDPSVFAALVRSPASTGTAAAAATPTDPVIVLDPGHGGVDSGARGLGGVQEKSLVFDFCVELKRQLEATKRYTIVMTRDGDQYVDLGDRVAIARKANASLFISVHADTLSEDASVSGSTVYTVADRASDAEAARIAARENAADRGPGGGGRLDNPDVADILFDLKRQGDSDLRPHLLAGPRRQLARRDEAQSQPGTLRRLRGSEGAGVSLRSCGARLSFERSGRPISLLPGVAGQGRRPPWSNPSMRSLLDTENPTAAQRRKAALRPRPNRSPRPRRINACAEQARRANGVAASGETDRS